MTILKKRLFLPLGRMGTQPERMREVMLDRLNIEGVSAKRAILPPETEKFCDRIGSRAENLFLTHQYYCSESVLLSLNHALGGGLSEEQAVGMAAPYSMAMGESGCACGALNGGILAIGLFTGMRGAFRLRRLSRRLAREFHDQFKAEFGSACCRILTRKVKSDPRAHRLHCARMTAWTAAAAARLLVAQYPELDQKGDMTYLDKRESRFSALLRNIQRWIRA